MNRTTRALLALGVATVALSVTAIQATAGGVTADKLIAAGWTCFLDPGAPRMVCSDPGHGRPPLNPAPGTGSATYNFKLFATSDGSFIGTSHLIRADLYNGQPCPQTGGLYFFIPPIGYYRCEHF